MHLLGPTKLDQFGGHAFVYSGQQGPCEACKAEQATHKNGSPRHLIDASREFPERVAAENIVPSSAPERYQPPLLGCCVHLPVMDKGFVEERSCFPTLHPRSDNRDQVDTTDLSSHISAYFF